MDLQRPEGRALFDQIGRRKALVAADLQHPPGLQPREDAVPRRDVVREPVLGNVVRLRVRWRPSRRRRTSSAVCRILQSPLDTAIAGIVCRPIECPAMARKSLLDLGPTGGPRRHLVAAASHEQAPVGPRSNGAFVGGRWKLGHQRRAVRTTLRTLHHRFWSTTNDEPVLMSEINAVLPPSGRDLRLDFFRGFANWVIFVDHIPNNIVNWLTTRNYGFSDAADLFVFISGYTAAFVYARVMLERGFVGRCDEAAETRMAALRRARAAVRHLHRRHRLRRPALEPADHHPRIQCRGHPRQSRRRPCSRGCC